MTPPSDGRGATISIARQIKAVERAAGLYGAGEDNHVEPILRAAAATLRKVQVGELVPQVEVRVRNVSLPPSKWEDDL